MTLCLSRASYGGQVMSVCPVFGDMKSDYLVGLPWWLSGKESACQCRGHRFHPWSGKISDVVEPEVRQVDSSVPFFFVKIALAIPDVKSQLIGKDPDAGKD